MGVSTESVGFSPAPLILGSRKIQGEAAGTAMNNGDMLKFSLEQKVKCMIEVVPLEKAPEAYAKMMANKARFRMVLKIT
ncbi:MAG TPA: hypothetical protein VGJ00_09855 [Rhabdochlamydiaceae bacterium]